MCVSIIRINRRTGKVCDMFIDVCICLGICLGIRNATNTRRLYCQVHIESMIDVSTICKVNYQSIYKESIYITCNVWCIIIEQRF